MHYNHPSSVKNRVIPYSQTGCPRGNPGQDSPTETWTKPVAARNSFLYNRTRPSVDTQINRSQSLSFQRGSQYAFQRNGMRQHAVSGRTVQAYVSRNQVLVENNKNVSSSGYYNGRDSTSNTSSPRRFSFGFKKQQVSPRSQTGRRLLCIPKIVVKDCSCGARDIDEKFYRREHEKARKFMDSFYENFSKLTEQKICTGDDQPMTPDTKTGTITVCKLITDATGEERDKLPAARTDKNVIEKAPVYKRNWSVWKVLKDYFSRN